MLSQLWLGSLVSYYLCLITAVRANRNCKCAIIRNARITTFDPLSIELLEESLVPVPVIGPTGFFPILPHPSHREFVQYNLSPAPSPGLLQSFFVHDF